MRVGGGSLASGVDPQRRTGIGDWGREVTFGCFLIPTAEGDPVAVTRQAETLGLDWVGIQDHPYQRRFFDTWVLMSAIAASTSRIGIFPDVACLPLRPPAMMAKAAASIDLLSGGRFELGLGRRGVRGCDRRLRR